MCQMDVLPSAAASDRSIAQVLDRVFLRPNASSLKVLRVTEYSAGPDERGDPTILASVTGPMELGTMRHLIEDEVVGGAAASQNDLAFIDRHVPDRMLFSPAVSRNLTQPLSQHLAAADRGAFPYWTLQDIIRASTAEELADAEAFAREHYGPAPPPGTEMARPVRRQRRGCRGGKGRKRHMADDNSGLFSPRSSVYSPRIMSAHSCVPSTAHLAPPGGLSSGMAPRPISLGHWSFPPATQDYSRMGYAPAPARF